LQGVSISRIEVEDLKILVSSLRKAPKERTCGRMEVEEVMSVLELIKRTKLPVKKRIRE